MTKPKRTTVKTIVNTTVKNTVKTIAIVGCGPKGLYSLDSLLRAARCAPSITLDVHIYEPAPHPGAGPIYDPDQPPVLVMNFPARLIDAWVDGHGPDLRAWLKQTGKIAGAGDFVPRAVVGQYLAWCFDRVVAGAPPNVRLTRHPARVTGLRRVAKGWRLSPGTIIAEEVLVTTGHQDWTRATHAGATHTGAAQTIASPFPIDRALSKAAVAPGAWVQCKGFALTFIDTVLALTEGRGGVFTQTGDTYSYAPSGDEPAVIAPYSRTARPMRPKVDPDRFVPPQGPGFWAARIGDFEKIAAQPGATFSADIWPAVLRIADSALARAPGSAAAFFADRSGRVFGPEDCRADLRKGYAVAVGASAPDICWALGEAWRQCYAPLVQWISHRDLSARDASLFRLIAGEMERLAFGPPARNIGKLICLESAGLVSLQHLSGTVPGDLSAPAISIDATIPPAGAAELSEPLAGLLRDGCISVGALGGVVVNDRAQALVDGTVTPGLSIIGRACEGSVLGNDTLSRSLHDHPARWAAHVTGAPANAQSPAMEQSA